MRSLEKSARQNNPLDGFYLQSDICSLFIKASGHDISEVTLITTDAALKKRCISESCSLSEFSNNELINELEKYLSGSRVDLDFSCDLSGFTPLEQRILSAAREIPYGNTATYEDIAIKVGNKNLSRVVGRTMSKNRCPIVIPCHRVVGKSGKLVGFSADGGLLLKRALLKLERIN
ncbi:methylated-DNA--[protein]-cysteine S-methyltransferase [Thermodesulfobacteriota bacterium]